MSRVLRKITGMLLGMCVMCSLAWCGDGAGSAGQPELIMTVMPAEAGGDGAGGSGQPGTACTSRPVVTNGLQVTVTVRGVYAPKNQTKDQPDMGLWEGRVVTEPVKLTFVGKTDTSPNRGRE